MTELTDAREELESTPEDSFSSLVLARPTAIGCARNEGQCRVPVGGMEAASEPEDGSAGTSAGAKIASHIAPESPPAPFRPAAVAEEGRAAPPVAGAAPPRCAAAAVPGRAGTCCCCGGSCWL